MSGSEASAGGTKQLLAAADRLAIRTGRLRDWALQDRTEKERKALDRALQTVASAKPADLQAVAASQIRLLDVYHDIGLNQARYSFHCALRTRREINAPCQLKLCRSMAWNCGVGGSLISRRVLSGASAKCV
jgi:hypothetical protein